MLIKYFIFSALLICTQGNAKPNILKSLNNERIVNGSNVKLGERPFQAFLTARRQYCGAAVISQNYVVTAAHCVFGVKPESVTIYVGAVDRSTQVIIHKVSKLIVHEDYYLTIVPANDIALVKVEHPFVFSETVSPISLMRTKNIMPGTSAWVSGWGNTGGPHSKPSTALKMAEIFVVDHKYCVEVMREVNVPIYPSNICAFNPIWRKGHCKGDSGGPLTINGELAGIVSWSYKDPYCASTKYPNVYTKVSFFIEWIEKHMEL